MIRMDNLDAQSREDDRLTHRINSTLKKQVFEKADRYDLSVSQITNRLLMKWVNNESMLNGEIGAVLLAEFRKKKP